MTTLDPIPMNQRISSILEEMQNQALHPPGDDMVMRACYLSLINYFSTAQNTHILESILTYRNFTPTHFVNIFFRAIQYIEMYEFKNIDYPQLFTTTAQWDAEIEKIFRLHQENIIQILLTRDTTTTIFQRYASVKIILNALFPHKGLSLVDLGCGGNLGIPGLCENKAFDTILDHTANKSATTLLSSPISISSSLSIDKEDPYESDAISWRTACSYYPHEIANSQFNETDSTDYKKYFLKLDITNTKSHQQYFMRKTHDAVILSTFIYQLSDEETKKVLEFAQSLLNATGVIIIQDFAIKEDGKLNLLNNWFSHKFPYATFILHAKNNWKPMEILRWKNGRCRELIEGSDYRFILEG